MTRRLQFQGKKARAEDRKDAKEKNQEKKAKDKLRAEGKLKPGRKKRTAQAQDQGPKEKATCGNAAGQAKEVKVRKKSKSSGEAEPVTERTSPVKPPSQKRLDRLRKSKKVGGTTTGSKAKAARLKKNSKGKGKGAKQPDSPGETAAQQTRKRKAALGREPPSEPKAEEPAKTAPKSKATKTKNSAKAEVHPTWKQFVLDILDDCKDSHCTHPTYKPVETDPAVMKVVPHWTRMHAGVQVCKKFMPEKKAVKASMVNAAYFGSKTCCPYTNIAMASLYVPWTSLVVSL